MTITMELREDGRILYSTITGVYTAADVIDSFARENAFRNQPNHQPKIHTLLDVSKASRIPPRGILRMLSQAPSLIHPTRGKLAIVSQSMFGQSIIELAAKLTGNLDVRFFNSENKAWDYLLGVLKAELAAPGVDQV